MAILAELFVASVRDWFSDHSLTTNLFASVVFAVIVYVAIERSARRREAARWSAPAREALASLANEAGRAWDRLHKSLDERFDELSESEHEVGKHDWSALPSFRWLYGDVEKRLATLAADQLYSIVQAEPTWPSEVLAPLATELAQEISSKVIDAAQIFVEADTILVTEQYGLQAQSLRAVSDAAGMVSKFVPPPESEPSPEILRLDAAMQELAPELEGRLGEFVREAVALNKTAPQLLADRFEEMQLDSISGLAALLVRGEIGAQRPEHP
ncbi:MAG: hypothetical protein ACRDKI_11650 [Solirubrobacterales bacterium]